MNYLKLPLLAAFGAVLVIHPVKAQTTHTSSGYRLWRGDTVIQSNGVTVDQMIADFVRKHKLPGITMAIVEAPYIPRSAGYGVIDIQEDELASTKTMWNIGPITQASTAVAIMQLKEAGKLSADDPVSNYLPESQQPGAK